MGDRYRGNNGFHEGEDRGEGKNQHRERKEPDLSTKKREEGVKKIRNIIGRGRGGAGEKAKGSRKEKIGAQGQGTSWENSKPMER